jgi:hypothetical protein
MMRDISDKQSLMELIDELQDLVDDKRERVAKLFADIRASVPRPMTLVFAKGVDDVMFCDGTNLQYWKSRIFADTWIGCERGVEVCRAASEAEIVDLLQSRFNAKWSEMTAKGAAT